MDTAEIRRRFLAHFEGSDHTVVPSASSWLDDRATSCVVVTTDSWVVVRTARSAFANRMISGRRSLKSV